VEKKKKTIGVICSSTSAAHVLNLKSWTCAMARVPGGEEEPLLEEYLQHQEEARDVSKIIFGTKDER